MAKPDDRSDNVEKLQSMIADTQENIRQANDRLRAHSEDMSAQDCADIEAKNDRREASIAGFREEVQDEAHAALDS